MAKGGSSKIKTGGMIAATTVVLAALVTGLVFATTALFTDEGTVTGRITAGDMQIGLYETGYRTAKLGDNGYINEGEYQDESPIDLLDTSGEYYTLFTMENAIPGVYTAKTIMVDGSGSDVAFSSVLTITTPKHYDSDNGTTTDNLTTADETLAEHIKITVYSGTGTGATTDTELGNFMLNEYENASITLGDCTAKGSLTFTIKAEFDTEGNVSAEAIRGASISFDINIKATQITESN